MTRRDARVALIDDEERSPGKGPSKHDDRVAISKMDPRIQYGLILLGADQTEDGRSGFDFSSPTASLPLEAARARKELWPQGSLQRKSPRHQRIASYRLDRRGRRSRFLPITKCVLQDSRQSTDKKDTLWI